MCRPGDGRSLSVKVASSRISREIYDVGEKKVIARLAPGSTTFGVALAPGQGKLLRIRPVYLIGGLRAGAQATGEFALGEAFPNPFGAQTSIRFELPEEATATLVVYDALGREVARLVDGEMEAGVHTVELDGSGLASGVYVYQLRAGRYMESRRFILIR